MEKDLLRKYAHTIAHIGANVEKGDEVWIQTSLAQPDFTVTLVEECYKLGAKHVEVTYSDSRNAILASKYEKLSTLSKISPYSFAKTKYFSKKLPTRIYILADDPDGMKGANQVKLAKAQMKTYPRIKPYRDMADGKYKWCIAAAPCKEWANKMFPHDNTEDAIEKLWEAILVTSRCEKGEGVQRWHEHHAFLKSQSKKLNDLHLVELRYKSSNGTDFKVGLIEDALFLGGQESLPNGKVFSPNIPSEEIFTSPMAGKAEGVLVATKPLSYRGELIEDFSFTFKDEKVVEAKARKGQKALETMINMDEGARMLGEVALVPHDSPISNTGLLFYETLFDENAACHVALGAGFQVFDKHLSVQEMKEKGVNDSMIHVDFMIGCADLDIEGTTTDGKVVQIFKNGNWAL